MVDIQEDYLNDEKVHYEEVVLEVIKMDMEIGVEGEIMGIKEVLIVEVVLKGVLNFGKDNEVNL